tara:strand:+ start:148 stop:513 length:366 start_codon:yes stop_codon:yes gene_type:complete
MRSYPIWQQIENNNYKNKDLSHGVRGEERNIIKIGSSKNHSYNFLETEIKYFTQENGTKVFLFYIDGELVKEASINPISDRIEMRSKIHPRDFTQKDMLFDFNIGSTSAVNKYNKREREDL